jgi:hypothetical protein
LKPNGVTNTDIDWWLEGRKKLNAIIREYNEWQIDGFNKEEKGRLLARIECGIQTCACTARRWSVLVECLRTNESICYAVLMFIVVADLS